MSYLTIILLIFSMLGALDRIAGNRFGLGKEFERAFMLLGTLILSIIGMIIISPLIAEVAKPLSDILADSFGIDPSIVPSSLFANDMGGASLSVEMARDERIGLFNALVVSALMGCTISFTIPFALGVVKKEQHKDLFLGLTCGIVTIPVGCFISGIVCGLSLGALVIDLTPLVLFSGIIVAGLLRIPEKVIKIFQILGIFLKILITVGLMLGIAAFLSGKELISGIGTFEEGATVCLTIAVVLSGAFPLMNVLARILNKPLNRVAHRIGINETSVVGTVSCLASSAITFGMMDKMDRKGVVMNAAFAVSAAFTAGSHLAFTMAFDDSYILAVIVGKLTAGLLALILAHVVYERSCCIRHPITSKDSRT